MGTSNPNPEQERCLKTRAFMSYTSNYRLNVATKVVQDGPLIVPLNGCINLKPLISRDIKARSGGETGIRTLEGCYTLLVFKTSAFNRSAISPSGGF